MNTDEFPLSITQKGVSAVIRKTEKLKAGQKHTYFIVEYILKGRRKQVWRSDLGAAKEVARDACIAIGNGGAAALELSDRDRFILLRANEAIAPLGLPLDVVAMDYAAAAKDLPPGTTMKDAVACLRRHNTSLEKRTVSQVADEMLVVKRAAGLSDVHLKNLECRLGRIGNDFNMEISSMSGTTIQAWLDKLDLAPRSKRNFMLVIRSLFGFAISRKYLPKNALDEVKAVQMPKEDDSEVEIFTPAEMREVLAAARPEMVPFLAVGAFAGLRSAEIVRLDWHEINLKERHIEIKAAKAKTGARRLAPVTDNLVKWLAPYVKKTGLVVNFDSWWNQIPKVAAAVNKRRGKSASVFTWKHNALRHSFCSYRIAEIKNAAQVALEAGNSPQMIFRHYRQLVNEKQAAEWFSVLPPATAKKTGRKLTLPETVEAVA